MAINIDKRLLWLFLLILCVHAATFLARVRFDTVAEVGPSKDDAPSVTIDTAALDAWKAAQAVKQKQQIVQTEHNGRPVPPKHEAFLGEKDMSFDRQTMARKVDVFNKAGKGTTQTDAAKPQPVAKSEPAPEPKAVPKKALKDLKFSDLGMATAAQPMPERKPASIAPTGIANGDEKSKGVSSTNDYVEHVALGDFTQLNTVEYKYYGFFHRIRQKLEQFWGKSLREKADALYKSGRRLPASDQYTTALIITMNEKGEIVHVKVKSSSGVRELDDAATESFNSAGPFPNPPSGLLVNGKATIEWGFVVQS